MSPTGYTLSTPGEIVEDAVTVRHADRKSLPPSASDRDFANKMQKTA